MSKYVSKVQWSSVSPGNVFALVHPGGLLLTPITVLDVGLDCTSNYELRANLHRYGTKANGGTSATKSPLVDGGSAAQADMLYGAVAWPLSPELSWSVVISSRGNGFGKQLLEAGVFTIAPNHTFVLELLDAVPQAPKTPLNAWVMWDE